MIRLAASVCLLILCWLPIRGFALNDAAWLYTVELPVEAQSLAERKRVSAEGLLVVLTRLTGLVSVPRSTAVLTALATPEAYYNQFVFISRELPSGVQARFLKVTFQEAAVQNLISVAQLPVWWAKRPSVLVWMVVEEAGERVVLNGAGNHPLIEHLRRRSAQRGLFLTLPLMDLTDTLTLGSADVWGKIGLSLDAASARYKADYVLVGRANFDRNRLVTGRPYQGDWEVWVDGGVVAENFAGVSAQEAANRGIDSLADWLAEKYAVLPRPLQAQKVSITGLSSAQDYAALMSYLENLEFIQRVAIKGLEAGVMRVALSSHAELGQLLMLLTAEGYLAKDGQHRGLDLQLIWRG